MWRCKRGSYRVQTRRQFPWAQLQDCRHYRHHDRLIDPPRLEIRSVLRYYTTYSDKSIPTFRKNLSVLTSRLKNIGFLDSCRHDGNYRFP